jgi:hypothetical protein
VCRSDMGGTKLAKLLQGKRVAISTADGVQRIELEVPRKEVQQAGAQTDLLSLHAGQIQARKNNDLDEGGTFAIDRAVSDASVDDYDACCYPAARSIPTSSGPTIEPHLLNRGAGTASPHTQRHWTLRYPPGRADNRTSTRAWHYVPKCSIF